MVNVGNLARIASLCKGFDIGALHGYFFHWDFWINLNFPLEHQIKLVVEVPMKRNFGLSFYCLT